MDISKAKEVLDYWFSKGVYTPDYDKWFMKSQDYDEEIKEKFGDLLKQAEHGKCFGWLVSKDSYLAHIILMDQFSRHIYRGKGDSFKNDKGCLIFVELGWELYKEELKGYEFMFAFMPFMHTESLIYQKKGAEHFHKHKKLYYHIDNNLSVKRPLTGSEHPSYSSRMGCIPEKSNNDLEWEMLKSMEPHMIGHKKTIEMFGRFPKRNKALERENTKQENEYLNSEAVKNRPY